MCRAPVSAIARNQRIVIGPNSTATFPVPRDCTANTATSNAIVIGST